MQIRRITRLASKKHNITRKRKQGTRNYSLLGVGIILSVSKWEKLHVCFLINKYPTIILDAYTIKIQVSLRLWLAFLLACCKTNKSGEFLSINSSFCIGRKCFCQASERLHDSDKRRKNLKYRRSFLPA